MKIYDSYGWVNWDYISGQTKAFCMVVGSRGTGKTYGLIKYLLDHEIKFIYLRRLKTQLDECGTIDSNPFKKLNRDTGRNIQPFRARNTIRFAAAKETDGKITQSGEPVALGIALSTFATIRGADYSDIDAIVFDEAVPMDGERTVKDEFNAFLNFYETINRNRELQGKPAVKCFLLGNANKLSNPYFAGWEFMQTALKMIAGDQMMWRSTDGTRIMIMLLHSPISEKKRGTALYQNGSGDFMTMAIDNTFRTDETNTRSISLSECNYICSVGQIGIYQLKADPHYFISSKTRKESAYDGYGMSLKLWQSDFFLMRTLYMSKLIYFESYSVELIFREFIGL